jgi:hypothetical protein
MVLYGYQQMEPLRLFSAVMNIISRNASDTVRPNDLEGLLVRVDEREDGTAFAQTRTAARFKRSANNSAVLPVPRRRSREKWRPS